MAEILNATGTRHWIDIGAGEAAAMIEYLTQKLVEWENGSFTVRKRGIKLTAITASPTPFHFPAKFQAIEEAMHDYQQDLHALLATKGKAAAQRISEVKGLIQTTQLEKSSLVKRVSDLKNNVARLTQEFPFSFLYGRYIEAIPTAEIEKAELVTDFIGALSYTEDLTSTLNAVGSLLKPGGVLLTALWGTKIFDRDGHEIPLAFFLQNMKGIALVKTEAFADSFYFSYSLKRTTGPLWVPPLKLIKYENSRPPLRGFVWDIAYPSL